MNLRRISLGPRMAFYATFGMMSEEKARIECDPMTSRAAAEDDKVELAMSHLAQDLLEADVAGRA